MMQVKDLDFRYRGSVPILRDISFEAGPGERVALLGNNGAGKSTLLKCLGRILAPQKGAVYVGRENVYRLSPNAAAQTVAFVPQQSSASRLTVYDTVMLGRKPYLKWGARQEDRTVVQEVLEQLGLEELAARFVDQVSGGEAQKVMLARALVQQPKVLLLDEPTSNLDLRNQYEVLELVARVCREREIAALIVMHDLNLALRYCDKFILIRENQVYDWGGEDIVTGESIHQVYGVAVEIHQIDGVKVVVPKVSAD